MDPIGIVQNSRPSKLDAKHFLNNKKEDDKDIFDIGFSEIMQEYEKGNLKEQRNITNHLYNISANSSKINTAIFSEIENILSEFEKSKVSPIGSYVLLVFYIIIILIGISGNVVVLIAILWKRSMRTPHNFFIAALAVSGKLY